MENSAVMEIASQYKATVLTSTRPPTINSSILEVRTYRYVSSLAFWAFGSGLLTSETIYVDVLSSYLYLFLPLYSIKFIHVHSNTIDH